eukprot:4283468-Pyramimonas_sp.AAC.1
MHASGGGLEGGWKVKVSKRGLKGPRTSSRTPRTSHVFPVVGTDMDSRGVRHGSIIEVDGGGVCGR